MKILFFGTPTFAADLLRFLLEQSAPIAAVVTQPDRPQGRSLKPAPSPAKVVALEWGIPILQPEKASQDLERLADFQADLFVVVAYGQILSQKLLNLPPLGCINVHPSLLPKYRGAAPIQRCLMAGERETGVAIQKMVWQLDAGDIIASSKMAIPSDMTFGELEPALCDLAKPLLLDVLRRYEKGVPAATPQDPALVTYASKFTLEDGELHWDKSSAALHNLVRAFSPRPGAWCWVQIGSERKRLKILRSRVLSEKAAPGTLLSRETAVACSEGALQLLEVQPEGKKAMSGADWFRGQKNISFII